MNFSFKNGNFLLLFEIISALLHPSIIRLKNTWKNLNEEIYNLFFNLNDFNLNLNNFNNLNNYFLKNFNNNNFYLPYFRNLIQDLININEIFQNFIDKDNLIINFSKFLNLNIYFEYFSFNNFNKSFILDNNILNIISDIKFNNLSSNSFFDLSLKIENNPFL